MNATVLVCENLRILALPIQTRYLLFNTNGYFQMLEVTGCTQTYMVIYKYTYSKLTNVLVCRFISRSGYVRTNILKNTLNLKQIMANKWTSFSVENKMPAVSICAICGYNTVCWNKNDMAGMTCTILLRDRISHINKKIYLELLCPIC